jgi:hypothetical protein
MTALVELHVKAQRAVFVINEGRGRPPARYRRGARVRVEHRLQPRDERLHVVGETLVVDAVRLAPDETARRLGEILLAWERRPVHENGNDRRFEALEADLKLSPNDISWFVEPATAVVGAFEPVLPDDDEHRAALRERLLKDGGEIAPERDRGHVHKHAGASETRLEVVPYPRGSVGSILAAVADEDAARSIEVARHGATVSARLADCQRRS